MKCIKRTRLCFYVVVFFSLLACHNSKNDKVEAELSRIENNTPFRIDSIETKSWDTLCIIKPYEALTNIKEVDFSAKEQAEIEKLALFDGHCTLLFIKNRKIVSYAVVARNIADFSTPDKTYFISGQYFRINNQKQVVVE